eukprot:6475707-Alexandrium_andersonii.AAC.1
MPLHAWSMCTGAAGLQCRPAGVQSLNVPLRGTTMSVMPQAACRTERSSTGTSAGVATEVARLPHGAY